MHPPRLSTAITSPCCFLLSIHPPVAVPRIQSTVHQRLTRDLFLDSEYNNWFCSALLLFSLSLFPLSPRRPTPRCTSPALSSLPRSEPPASQPCPAPARRPPARLPASPDYQARISPTRRERQPPHISSNGRPVFIWYLYCARLSALYPGFLDKLYTIVPAFRVACRK